MAENLETQIDGIRILTLAPSDPLIKNFEAFLFTTYLKSYRFGNEYCNEIAKEVYFPTHHKRFLDLLGRPDAILKLAVLTEDPDIIIGWALIEPTVLHYVFVKGSIEARKLGIASLLIPKDTKTVTHLTKTGKILKAKNKWDYNPYL